METNPHVGSHENLEGAKETRRRQQLGKKPLNRKSGKGGKECLPFPSFPAFLFATGITFSMTPWKGQAGPMKPTNDTKQIPVETGRDETLMGFANGRIVRAPLRLIAFGGG